MISTDQSQINAHATTPSDGVTKPTCDGCSPGSASSDCAMPTDAITLAEQRRRKIEAAREKVVVAANRVGQCEIAFIAADEAMNEADSNLEAAMTAVIDAGRELTALLESQVVDFSRTTVPKSDLPTLPAMLVRLDKIRDECDKLAEPREADGNVEPLVKISWDASMLRAEIQMRNRVWTAAVVEIESLESRLNAERGKDLGKLS